MASRSILFRFIPAAQVNSSTFHQKIVSKFVNVNQRKDLSTEDRRYIKPPKMVPVPTMNPAEPNRRNPSSQEIMKEFRTFMNGVSFGSKCSRSELARSAIFLLQTLPPAREAILDFMCLVFDDAVSTHSIKLELEMGPSVTSSCSAFVPGSAASDKDENIIRDVRDVLTEFINTNPESWAPIVSTWSLDLLGQLSSKYADRRSILHASNLNEVLQLWMGCPPTHILVDLSTLCISTLINSSPDLCIDALLDTSVQHSPHFDWVVAHIGSCFPTTVITRVLSCGLKDFCCHGENQANAGPALLPTPDKKVPKMASVVGILGHLAGQHSEDIRKALLALFQGSLVDKPTMQHLATVPFLLQLSSMSAMLRRVVTTDLIKTLTSEVLNKLRVHVPLWCQYTGQSPDELMSLCVHLVLKSENGGEQIMRFLLNTAAPDNGNELLANQPQVQTVCGHILDFLLLEIQCLVNSKANGFRADVPILETLQHSVPMLCHHLLNGTAKKAHWVTKLLTCLVANGGGGGDSKASEAVAYVLVHAGDLRQLSQLEHLITLIEPSATEDHLAAAVSRVFVERIAASNHCPLRFLGNLLCLVRWESEGFTSRSNFTTCLQGFLLPLAEEISHPDAEAVHAVMEILSQVPLPDSLSVSVLTALGTSAVVYFFQVVGHAEMPQKLARLATHRRFVSKLCEHHSVQQLVLRSLIEGALDSANAWHFGAATQQQQQRTPDAVDGGHFALLRENQKRTLSVTLPHSHSMVCHGGVIANAGAVGQASAAAAGNPCGDRLGNVQLLLEVIKAACVPCRCTPEKFVPGPVPTAEGMVTVALLLVELVSSDVMFNGFPWPDEEFTKVTIERDLHIKRAFDENPVLWDLLYLVATFHPALCYCSVLLRALAAVVMSFWAGCQERTSDACPEQLQATFHLIGIMAVGQVLPPPLSYVGEIVNEITPYEVHILLVDVWKYMKENVPSPAAFTSVDSQGYHSRDFDAAVDVKYVDRLHCILQNNISKFGHVVTHFFSHESSEVLR